MADFRVLIAGAGQMGRGWRETLRDCPDTEIVAWVGVLHQRHLDHSQPVVFLAAHETAPGLCRCTAETLAEQLPTVPPRVE